jgi:predicted lipid-binding transport protein (Tim44 family)
MLGKIAGAMLGKRLAGRHAGSKGALIGLGAAALARRSVPALVAVTAGGWAFNKWRERRARRAAYPAGAAPSSPSGASVS